MLSYEQSLEFIHSIARFGTKPGLRRVTLLLERMGNPQNRLRFVHVAGTDGKGSTCTMISHIYREAGYRTGLYISPFVLDFRERIQLDNQMISREELAASTTAVKIHWDALDAIGETPTEFEVVVAIAMDYFLRQRCDVVVLEVGMGGRFDATNVIPTPLCSVITHISLDHMQYLGDTLEQIAFEKCGIIKPGGVTVCYPHQDPAALAVIMERAAQEANPLKIGHRAEIIRADITGSEIRYGDLALSIPLPGEHQVWNAVTAVEAVQAAAERGLPVAPEHIVNGIGAVRFPSRVEVLCKEPLVILDGGHNPAEAQALSKVLEQLHGRPIDAVMGMLADKDVSPVLGYILPYCRSLTTVTPDYPRALPAHELAQAARPYCDEITVEEDKAKALSDAYACCGTDGVLLACGSLYLSSELRPILLELIADRIDFGK